MPDPGGFRHRVTIQSSTVSPNGVGGNTRTTVKIADVWARIVPTTSHEVVSGGGVRAQTMYQVTIRYPDFALDASMRLVWNGRTFVIKGITQPNMVTQTLVLTCLEGE